MAMRSRVPSYRLHKRSGQAVVTLSGHDHYLGVHGSDVSKREYDRVVREWLAQGRQLQPSGASRGSYSVAELIQDYWAFVRAHYVKNGKPSGEQACVKAALRPVVDLYGHRQAGEFGPQSLVACRDTMVDKGWSRYTINKHVGRVRRMFAWATERELIPGTIYHALQAVKGLQRGRTADLTP